jgi:UDP-N-acetylmuramate dehydrogenase
MIAVNISLKPYNSFGLDNKADHFITIESEEELSVPGFMDSLNRPVLIIGGGSNFLFTQDFNGTIIHPVMEGITIEDRDSDSVLISAGAGVKWDTFVECSVNNGFGGVENLSLIPGTVGAAPVQNIGAYGVEVKDVIEKLRAYSLSDGSVKEFTATECKFRYRNSIFKEDLKGKYLITMVYFRLRIKPVINTGYGSLREEAEQLGPLTIKTVRQAVIRLRKSRLPEPEKTGNAGSFFKNPVISEDEAVRVKEKYSHAPFFRDESGSLKLSAAWMIEECGWKGKRFGNAGVYEKHALILVNYGNASGKEIFDLSELIKESVYEKFGIVLQREVEVI